MNSTESFGQLDFGAPELPSSVTTRDGFTFDPRQNSWWISSLQNRSSKFEFSDLLVLSNDVVIALKLGFVDVLEKQSLSHARNLYVTFRLFYKDVLSTRGTVALIDMADLLRFRSILEISTVWKLGVLRVLIERVDSLGCAIATADALMYLNDAVIRGNTKGNNVRARDTESGPFTTQELEQLNSSVNQAYVEGLISLQQFVLFHLLLAFGVRSRQIASLKESDLIIALATDGSKVYSLRIPRAKQRGELARDSFRVRPCDARLGRLLEQLLEYNIGKKADCPGPCESWPLLIDCRPGDVPGFAYHTSAAELGRLVIRGYQLVREALLESDASLNVTARRFRYTMAKRAHDDGADIYVIAELLDHSDIQNAGVYTEGSVDIIDRLNRTVAMELAPVAQAFAGLLISSDDLEAKYAGAGKRIHDRALLSGNGKFALGNCGMHGFCGLARPLACYTCRNFRPWDDGPHDEVLDKLLADRELERSKGRSPRIFSLHDRTITAVARVVQLCDERRRTNPTAIS